MKLSRFQPKFLAFERFELIRLIGVHEAQFEFWDVQNRETNRPARLLFLPPGVCMANTSEGRFNDWMTNFSDRDKGSRLSETLRPVDFIAGADSAFEIEGFEKEKIVPLGDVDWAKNKRADISSLLADQLRQIHGRKRAQGYFDSRLVFSKNDHRPVLLPNGLVQCILDELYRLDPGHHFFARPDIRWEPGTIVRDAFLFARLVSELPINLPSSLKGPVERALDGDPMALSDFLLTGSQQRKAVQPPKSAAGAPVQSPGKERAKTETRKLAPSSHVPNAKGLLIGGVAISIIFAIIAIATRQPFEDDDGSPQNTAGEYSIPDDWFAEEPEAGTRPSENLPVAETLPHTDLGNGMGDSSETTGRKVETPAISGQLSENIEETASAESTSDGETEETHPPSEPEKLVSSPSGAVEGTAKPVTTAIPASQGNGDDGSQVTLSPQGRQSEFAAEISPSPSLAKRSQNLQTPPTEEPFAAGRPSLKPPGSEQQTETASDEVLPDPQANWRKEESEERTTHSDSEERSEITPPKLGSFSAVDSNDEGESRTAGEISHDSATIPLVAERPTPSVDTVWLDPPKTLGSSRVLGYSSTPITERQWREVLGNKGGISGAEHYCAVTPKQAREFLETLTRKDRENGRLLDGFSYQLPSRDQIRTSALLTREDRAAVAKPFTYILVKQFDSEASIPPAGNDSDPGSQVASEKDRPLWKRPR